MGCVSYGLMSNKPTIERSVSIVTSMTNPQKKTPSNETKKLPAKQTYDISSVMESVYRRVNENEQYPNFSDRLEAYNKFFPSRQYSLNDVLRAMRQINAWKPAKLEKTEKLLLKDASRNDGREFISFDRFKVETLLPGDTLKLPIENLDVELTMEVDTIELQQAGSVTWLGHLVDYPTAEVSITQGEGLTLGAIHFPKEHFAFQVNGDVGWVASSSTLFKESEVDYLLPEGNPQDEGT